MSSPVFVDEPPKLAAAIQITMTTTGQVNCQVQAEEILAVFMAIGSAVQQLAQEYKRKQSLQVEIATPGVIQRLPS